MKGSLISISIKNGNQITVTAEMFCNILPMHAKGGKR